MLSPGSLPISARTRRTSMYVRGTNADNEFSKVFRTPVKPVEPVREVIEERELPEKVKLTKTKAKTPVSKDSPAIKVVLTDVSKKAVTPKVSHSEVKSPKQLKKTPANKLKSPKSQQSAKNTDQKPPKIVKNTPVSKLKSPKSVSSTKQIKKSHPSTPTLQSSNSLKKTPSGDKLKSPKPTRSAMKTPKSMKKAAEFPKTEAVSSKTPHVTSTPLKTLEQITSKSFYGTPQETPARNDDLIVFSAKPQASDKPSQKKAIVSSKKVASTKKPRSTPMRLPSKKTPAVKRQIVESDDETTPLEAKLRKIEKDVPSAARKTLQRVQKRIRESDIDFEPIRVKLSPVQMSSVLRDVHQQEKQEKRKASESPSPRPSKLAKIATESLKTTPRVMKMGRRTSPKKLAELSERNQSLGADWSSEGESSFLNETVNTDSRSGRCTIL